jgi:hypothetical protein
VGMVGTGAWKSVVNGLPKFAMAAVSTLGKWSIMAQTEICKLVVA